MNLEAQLIELKRTLYFNKFRSFVEAFWPEVSDYPFKSGWHLDAICEHLQAVWDKRLTNLLLNVCPRSGKSVIASVLFPVWWSLHDPTAKVLHASHSHDLTAEHASLSRRLIQSPKFQRLFPGILELDGETSAKDFYKFTSGGQRLSLSVGSKSAGWDSTLTILDDLHDIRQRESEAERKKAIEFLQAVGTRSVPGQRVPRIIVGQRVHQDDVSGWIIENYKDDPSWSFLILPCEYQPDHEQYHNALGFTDPRTEPGKLIWAEGIPAETIEARKKELRGAFSILYNQDPIPKGGDYFKAPFPTYSEDADSYTLGDKRFAKKKAWTFTDVDLAASTRSSADWTVIATWDVVGRHLLLRDLVRKRLDGTQIVPTIQEVYNQLRPEFVLIEQEFTGRVFIDQLRQAGLPVRAFPAKQHGDKEVRSMTAQTKLEAGELWFPMGKPWMAEVETELLAFPNGRHDDIVDCVSMAAITAQRYRGTVEPILPAEEEAKVWAKKQQEHRQWMENVGI